MIPLRAHEIAHLTEGRMHGVDPDAVVSAPSTVDSRAVAPGGLFVAVVGERVDGHDYAAQAVRSGAVLVLASRPVDVPCVVVDDPVTALGLVAAEVVRRIDRVQVITVTGSQGKTGTKDLLRQVLERHGETVATEGNLNNEIGVPLTATRATSDTRFLVVEMGARHIGNIAYLCGIARPDVGVVLNVGVAHVGEFGSREGIAQAKGEMVEALSPDGYAVLNADDALVTPMRARTRASVLSFGETAGADVQVTDLTTTEDGDPAFVLVHAGSREPVRLRLLGRHQAANAAAAAAAATAAGIALADVAAGLSAATQASRWRMERHTLAGGGLLINDAYNANPDSMHAALSTLASVGASRGARTVAVLGAMLELGDTAEAEHREVGRLAHSLGIGALVVVGEAAGGIADGWGGAQAPCVSNADEAVRALDELLAPGDVVLVKASRVAGLERVARELANRAGHTSSRPAGPPGADERTNS